MYPCFNGMQVQHEADQCPLQAGADTQIKGEAGAGDFLPRGQNRGCPGSRRWSNGAGAHGRRPVGCPPFFTSGFVRFVPAHRYAVMRECLGMAMIISVIADSLVPSDFSNSLMDLETPCISVMMASAFSPLPFHLGNLVRDGIAPMAELLQFCQNGFALIVDVLKSPPVDLSSSILHGFSGQFQIFSDQLDFQHICPLLFKVVFYTGPYIEL